MPANVAYNFVKREAVLYVSINCTGKWRNLPSHVYSPNGTVYRKKQDGTFAVLNNDGYSYDYLFVEDIQLFFQEGMQHEKNYLKFSLVIPT